MIYLVILAGMIWLYLITGHGKFWQEGPILPPARPLTTPKTAIIVPARDEADHIEAVLRALLAQDYAGKFSVILVDDQSMDGTGTIADPRLRIITGRERPPGWAGKLWAVSQGIEAAGNAEYLFLTDADIIHDPRHLSSLIAQALNHGCGMVSEMVALSTANFAERALIPAFVYFFAMLYPFAWVNDAGNRVAAAAGGSMLVQARVLVEQGGIAAIRGALIDDVALGKLMKEKTRIFLGHSQLARSIRPYETMEDIWRMVSRSAYVQLRYSPFLLVGTVLGMALVWLVAPLAMLFGGGLAQFIGICTYAASCASFLPTLRRFNLSAAWAPALPLIAIFYVAATISSAIDHYNGAGVQWKRRSYTA